MITPRDVTWRPSNEAEHVARHGVPFEIAARVFLDPARRETVVRQGRQGDGFSFAVIFAVKEDVAHIISARRANNRERR